MTGPFLINADDDPSCFPPVELALRDPDGLLAIGGDLSPEWLISAYRQGIFPWFSDDQPILWWSPDPRAVLFPDRLHVSRSLKKALNRQPFRITLDQAFEPVMHACAAPRKDQPGTWITPAMHQAYLRLHHMGVAHSVEAWQGDTLVGGLYGLAIGRVFFGESMFSHASNASKIAFVHLVERLRQWQYALIDCQVSSSHLQSLGAVDIQRSTFIALLREHGDSAPEPQAWRTAADASGARHSHASA